ncbi:hypothetical protein BJV78DRAFT_1345447 [Lactifluus subvellereus]|nr:hypothetical protein BJV78DRAFT_1345447 [Lactifluus subvellereus]
MPKCHTSTPNCNLEPVYAYIAATTHLQTWEDNGWIGVKNADLFKRTAFLLRSRIATTDFQWVKGHDGTLGNEQSDRLAKEGANKPDTDLLPLTTPSEFDLQGAKLATITQATAYQGIRERHTPRPRPTTERNIQTARNAIYEYNGTLETEEYLWKGTRNRTIRTRIQQFLYKALHGTQKIGEFWGNIPNYEERETCDTCDVADIVVPDRDLHPRRPDQPQERSPKGAMRLLQILLSEFAYLIWVLRCEREIQKRTQPITEILATKIKRDKKSTQTVKNTWEHVLRKDADLPDDWITSREVLVGRRTRHTLPPY